tara:strand:- start:542 stop:808 length:267 start_codon:yes stop_codon:yes gene_type:complete
MKYYFFRDLDNESNLNDGKTYHAAGYIDEMFCDICSPNPSGKDFAVCFFSPFKGCFESAWRAVNEVEVFEVDEWEYNDLVENISLYKQ